MSTAFNYHYDPVLPWTETRNDDRFMRIVKWILLFFIVIGAIIPWLPSPEAEKQQLKQVAPRLAKLITEKKKKPPAPPPIKKAKKKKLPVKKKPQKKLTKKREQARKQAQKSGLMAMSRDIQDLQSMFDLSSLANKPLQTKTTKKVRKTDSVLTSQATKSSGGVDTSKLSRSTGNTSLAGRTSSKVASNINTTNTSQPRRSSGGANTRTDEELTIIFDKYKGSLEAIYVRALRKDPTLQGKVVFELTISPSGQVVKARIISSELNSKSVERRMVLKVKSFRFPPKSVATVTVTYPVDFLPS